MDYKDLKERVVYHLKYNKPRKWRDGQFVFNYIDCIYGVARDVQFKDGVDCFYDDTQIDEFIKMSAKRIIVED
jgi:hypothetical protein